MSCLGIIAAFPQEIKPLVRDWQAVDLTRDLAGVAKGDAAWRGRVGEAECVAVAAGMKREAAARACEIAEQVAGVAGGLYGLASVGWAGALSCGVSPGQAYPVAEVVDANSGERFATSFGPDPAIRLRLLTLDHVAKADEKRRLAEKFQTVFVDMEAAEVARIARQKSLSFFCFKAISDAAGEVLPDFDRYTNAEGRLETVAFLGHVATRPRYWRPVARMGKNSKIAAEALAKALQQFLSEKE